MGDGGGRSEAPEWLGKALLEGYPDQLAVRFSAGSSGFQLSDGRRGQAADTSILKTAKVVVVGEVAEIEGREVRVVLNDLTEVEEEWLEELFPGEFATRVEAVYDAPSRRVRAREVKVFRDLVLESRERGEPDPDEAGALLAREVVAGNLVLKGWDHAVEQWIARVNCLAEWMPELELPRIGEGDREFLMAQVCAGAKGYKEIKDRSPWPVLKTWLSGPQRAALDSYAPERVALSNGRSAKVAYGEGDAPKIGVILQQLYDVNENPLVAGGKVTVVVEVLAPNRRPAQVTGDLGAFWKSSYEGVKKELKGRYPKHEWR
ncbi:MAG: ATP-dependent helicase C-terminal domain-containing protein [Verrucomicrobiales bacterium]|nr:ATP-dependent helicase C-terminal domain-containing protein [Verrucomicrobiales bacterium]